MNKIDIESFQAILFDFDGVLLTLTRQACTALSTVHRGLAVDLLAARAPPRRPACGRRQEDNGRHHSDTD